MAYFNTSLATWNMDIAVHFLFAPEIEQQFLFSSCTETLTDTMFVIYTSFVMHTHNMCFYLQSLNWQNRLDRTVDRLQDNSEQVAEKLEVNILSYISIRFPE